MNILLVDENKVIQVIPFKTLEINGKDIKYENDEGPAILEGIKPDIYVVEDSYEVDQELSDDDVDHLQSIDKKEDFIKLSLEERLEQLKTEKEMSDMALIELAQILLGGMGGG